MTATWKKFQNGKNDAILEHINLILATKLYPFTVSREGVNYRYYAFINQVPKWKSKMALVLLNDVIDGTLIHSS